jgi:hypothetical protein
MQPDWAFTAALSVTTGTLASLATVLIWLAKKLHARVDDQDKKLSEHSKEIAILGAAHRRGERIEEIREITGRHVIADIERRK